MASSTIKNSVTDLRNANPLYNTTAYNLLGDTWYWDKSDTKSVDDGVNIIVTTRGKRLKRKAAIVQPPAPQPQPTPVPEPIPAPTPTGNVVDVAAKYGVKTGTTIDNTAALLRLNADYKGYGRPLVEFDFRNCGTGEIRYSENGWLHAIDRFIVRAPNIIFRCTSSGPFDSQRISVVNGGIFWPGLPGSGVPLNVGYRFRTVGAGSTTISLIETPAVSLTDRVWLGGFEEQGYGEPTNDRHFEHKIAKSVSGGIVEFTTPLEKFYNELWKDWMMPGLLPPNGNGSAPHGKPRIYKVPDTYTSYAKFIGCTFGKGTNARPEQMGYFMFRGMEVICEDCTIEEDWPTENKIAIRTRCKILGGDLDKNINYLQYNDCNIDGLNAATGVDVMDLNNCTINGPCKLSPRILNVKGGTSKVTSEHNFQPHPEPSWIEKVSFQGMAFTGPNKAVEYSGTWVIGKFISNGATATELILADTPENQEVIRKLGFNSRIFSTDGASGTVKDIIYPNGSWVIQLINITGTLKANQTWETNTEQKVIASNNTSTNGQQII